VPYPWNPVFALAKLKAASLPSVIPNNQALWVPALILKLDSTDTTPCLLPKDNDSEPLFASRTLFAGCLIESHLTHNQEAQELCRRRLEVLEKKKIDSRDISLAQLAQAESYFLSGDRARSREAIQRSMDHTAKMFQSQHQDTASALELLARVDLKEGKAVDALTHAKAAVDTAAAVFGEGAGGTKAPTKTLLEASKANVT
jgi:hypothetical protein